MSEEIKLDQSADVLWIPVDRIRPKDIGGGEQRHFSLLSDAIKFVMDDLLPRDRATAWITLNDGSLKIEEIERIYRQMKA